MTNVMTPSKATTDGQIVKAAANYRALLEKHAPEFGSDAVQQVLGDPDFAAEQFAVFRTRVEALSSIIVRSVKVIRSRTPQAMLDATGRVQYVSEPVVAAMPRGDGDEVEVHFFPLKQDMSDEEVDRQHALRGLRPADPYSVGAVNEIDPAFADAHPNFAHWKDANGKLCYAAFDRWNVGRVVNVSRSGNVWRDTWWAAGLRK